MGHSIGKIRGGNPFTRIVRGNGRVIVISAEKIAEGYWQPRTSKHRRDAHPEFKVWRRLKADFLPVNKGLQRNIRTYNKLTRVIELDDRSGKTRGTRGQQCTNLPVLPGELPDKKFGTHRAEEAR